MPEATLHPQPSTATGPSQLTVRLITDVRAWREMEQSWNALLSVSESNCPFLTHQWLTAWWEVHGQSATLFVLSVEDASALVGAIPLYAEKRASLGGKIVTLRFLGDRDCGADFLNLLVRQDREHQAIAALAGHLVRDPSWHALLLEHVDASSRIFAHFSDQLRGCARHAQTKLQNFCPCMAIPESFEAFLRIPNTTFKRIIAKDAARYGKKHAMFLRNTFETEELGGVLERLFQTHTERFGLRNGTLGNASRQLFYRMVSERFHAQGWLCLTATEIDGVIEAVEYSILYGKAVYFLQSGISQRGLAHKAGNIQLFNTIRLAVGQANEFHFLRGEEPYKYQWGCKNLLTMRYFLDRGTRGGFFSWEQTAVQTLKTLKRAIRPSTAKKTTQTIPPGQARPHDSRLPPKNPLHARWMTDIADWQAMSGQWDELAARSCPDNPFMTYGWLSAWWATYGSGRKLALGIVESGSDLLGIAPFWCGWKGRGALALRTLSYLGGDYGGGEYLDFLVRPEQEKPFFQAMAGLLSTYPGLHRVCLERQDAAAPSHVHLKTALTGRPMMFTAALGYAYPSLKVPADQQAFEQAITPWTTKGWSRENVQVVLDIPAKEHGAALDRLCALHAAQAAARGDENAFADPRKRQFYAALLEGMGPSGLIRLSGIRSTDGYEVVEIGMGAGTAHFALESGASPEAERMGLDRLLTARVMDSVRGRTALWSSLKYHDPRIRELAFALRPTINVDIFCGARGRAIAAAKAVADLTRTTTRLLRPRCFTSPAHET